MTGAPWVGQTPGNVATKINAIGARARNMRPVTDAWGRRITVQSIPEAVLAGGRPPFKPVMRFGVWAATPLYNLGKMVNSIYYEPRRDGCTVFSGRTTPQAGTMHFGAGNGTTRPPIRPSGHPYLAIPAIPEAAGKSPRDFPGGFFRGHTYCRRVPGGGFTEYSHMAKSRHGKSRELEVLFFMVREVHIPARPWFKTQPDDTTWLMDVSGAYVIRGER